MIGEYDEHILLYRDMDGRYEVHAFDQEIFEDARELMGPERIEVKLDARIRWAGSYYRYPLQFQDMIRVLKQHALLVEKSDANPPQRSLGQQRKGVLPGEQAGG